MDKIFFSKTIYPVSSTNYFITRKIDPKLIPGKLFRGPVRGLKYENVMVL